MPSGAACLAASARVGHSPAHNELAPRIAEEHKTSHFAELAAAATGSRFVAFDLRSVAPLTGAVLLASPLLRIYGPSGRGAVGVLLLLPTSGRRDTLHVTVVYPTTPFPALLYRFLHVPRRRYCEPAILHTQWSHKPAFWDIFATKIATFKSGELNMHIEVLTT